MNPGEWIALVSLFVVVLLAVVGGAVYVVREMGKTQAAIPAATRSHELGCANFDPKENTAPHMQVLK